MKNRENEFYKWLKSNDASFADSFTIIWWSIFNKNKYNILIKGYYEGYNFRFAMKTARTGKFD